MFHYPLGGIAHIYINNHDLSEFGAKLATNYSISGYEVTNSYNQGVNRNSFMLFRQTYGLLTLKLPLDFSGSSKAQTMERIARFHAMCSGNVEINLSDGFSYSCMLTKASETQWLNDEHCTIDYTFTGIRHKEPVSVAQPSPLRLYNAGTWPRNDCIITIKDLVLQPTDVLVIISIYGRELPIQTWRITPKIGRYTGGDLVLDGINKRNLYNGGNIPTGTMVWTDYPYLQPGVNVIAVDGAISSADLQVEYIPAYL